jgi:GT2 family glycosyltransferase
MSDFTPRVLVIIVTWNKQEYLLQLLQSLSQLNYPEHRRDLLVVDNASDDGTVALIKAQFPHVRVLCNAENLGGTGGFNTGLQWGIDQPPGDYDYFWLLDNDVVVHRNALADLVDTLQRETDAAIAGSTMMQLDYPYRINEMGAFVDRVRGDLLFHRHRQKVAAWSGRPLTELLSGDGDLSRLIDHCAPYLDVDYVAAASLLVRESVVRQAGLWRDYFIHYDDVEWCLRISGMGYRVLVSARSLIWHLSAVAKVPTWILYYDNRNIQDLLQQHGVAGLRAARRYALKKAVYYTLCGKVGLGQLILRALDDFSRGAMGKQTIDPGIVYRPLATLETVLHDPSVKHIQIAWTSDIEGLGWQPRIARALRQRPELTVTVLVPASRLGKLTRIPSAHYRTISDHPLWRYLSYLRARASCDLVIQSDYRMLPLLSWCGKEILFANYEGCARLPAPTLTQLIDMGRALIKRWR